MGPAKPQKPKLRKPDAARPKLVVRLVSMTSAIAVTTSGRIEGRATSQVAA